MMNIAIPRKKSSRRSRARGVRGSGLWLGALLMRFFSGSLGGELCRCPRMGLDPGHAALHIPVRGAARQRPRLEKLARRSCLASPDRRLDRKTPEHVALGVAAAKPRKLGQ